MVRSALFRLTFAGVAVVATLIGCASSKSSAKADKICTAGNYVFCRCANREEGTKLCNEDGTAFGKCEPCETPDNPEDPDADPFPPYDGSTTDGGSDAPSASCGDKVVQDGEDCDDGNKDDTDGCDQKCKLAGADPLATRSCPGLDVHVWASPVVYDGTTTGSPNTASSPTCPSSEGNVPTTGAAAGDRVFKVTVHKGGTLKVVTSNTSYNNYLYASDGCKAGDNPYLACANKVDGVGGETIAFPVQAGKTYTVFVDGAGISGNTGTFRVTFSM